MNSVKIAHVDKLTYKDHSFLNPASDKKNPKKISQIHIFKEYAPRALYPFILMEKDIFKKKSQDIIIKTFSRYSVYINWSLVIKKNFIPKNNIDSLISYFISFIMFKVKANIYDESRAINFFNTYSFFYDIPINYFEISSSIRNVNNRFSSKENQYFYKDITKLFYTSEFYEITDENSVFLVINQYNSISIKSKVKQKVKKLISFDFDELLKEEQEVKPNFIISYKLKRIMKFGNKLKKDNLSTNLPYNHIFIKKKKVIKKGDYRMKKGYRIKKIKKKYLIKDKVKYKKTFAYKLIPTSFNATYTYSNPIEQVKKIVSLITQTNFTLYKVNALSVTRFEFELVRTKKIKRDDNIIILKKSAEFLSQFERKIEARYRYVAIYIKDLVRITFFCIYLKKADFIANFYASLLSKLPRKRKETKLIIFFVKILKIFSSQRIERIAIRLRFQGRLNRWRRTKAIVGQKGFLEYYSYKSRIEFGIGQAITRKGAQGIRIWLCYDLKFKLILKKAIFNYRSLYTLQNKF